MSSDQRSGRLTDKASFLSSSNVNYGRLVCEMVKALRAGFSQRTLSQQLGYTFNQVGKWESGATQLTWDDFVRLSKHLGIPLEVHFRSFFWAFSGDFTAKNIIGFLLSDHSSVQAAVPWTASTIRRLKSGEAQLMLADALQVIGVQKPLLFGWLMHLVDPAKLSEVKIEYQHFLQQIEIVASEPLCVYVQAAIELDVYKRLALHDENLLARHATCSVTALREVLRTLVENRIIYFDGFKYKPLGTAFSFGGLKSTKLRSLTRYTTSLTAARYSSVPIANVKHDWINPSVSSVRISPMSVDASQKVLDLVDHFYRNVAEIVASDIGPKENLQIFLMHFYPSVANAPEETD